MKRYEQIKRTRMEITPNGEYEIAIRTVDDFFAKATSANLDEAYENALDRIEYQRETSRQRELDSWGEPEVFMFQEYCGG